jgi:hypothetical protein
MLSPAQMATRAEKQKAVIAELKEKIRALKGGGAKASARTASTSRTTKPRATKARPRRRAATRGGASAEA